ncbi:unnamed protein product [Closterium sp. NIES-64]|nr:unnamed protein product [Closterium sp. NIES-64]
MRVSARRGERAKTGVQISGRADGTEGAEKGGGGKMRDREEGLRAKVAKGEERAERKERRRPWLGCGGKLRGDGGRDASSCGLAVASVPSALSLLSCFHADAVADVAADVAPPSLTHLNLPRSPSPSLPSPRTSPLLFALPLLSVSSSPPSPPILPHPLLFSPIPSHSPSSPPILPHPLPFSPIPSHSPSSPPILPHPRPPCPRHPSFVSDAPPPAVTCLFSQPPLLIRQALATAKLPHEQPLLLWCRHVLRVTPTASFQKDLGLDSLDGVEVVMAFEEEFAVEIPDADADKIQSCADAIAYIASHPQAK